MLFSINNYHKKLFHLLIRLFFSLLCLNTITHANAQNHIKKESSSQVSPQNNPISMEAVQRFTTALAQIRHYYIKNIKDEKLFEDAIRGVLAGLDPHSSYLNAKELRALTTTTSGKFGGLGIEITSENNFIRIISPIEDSPAYKVGIKAGDYIIKINNKSTHSLALADAIKLMRGPTGSLVKLTVLRKNEKSPLIFDVKRDIIKIKSIKSELLENKYAYIKITHFQEATAKNFIATLKKLHRQTPNGLKGLILDLRDNPGGLLDSAIEVSDTLIHNDSVGEEELIVYTEGRTPHSKFVAKANPGDFLKGEPIIAMINEGSASGAEIVAGALRDNKRAILIGTKTFGKGSVQTIIPIDEKNALKLTTALYYTPSGDSIQAKGLKPDIVIEDLSITKTETSNAEALNLSESDLLGHIETQPKNTEKLKNNIQSNLVKNDYQIREALTILKAMKLSTR